MIKIFLNTDGGARGNPGPAGIGVVFYDDKEKIIYKYKEFIGEATNNEAEYKAIIKGLQILTKSKWFSENNNKSSQVVCRLDSQLVVEQVNGNYKVKQEHIKRFIGEINKLKQKFNLDLSFIHIVREKNKEADRLVNEALDEKLKK